MPVVSLYPLEFNPCLDMPCLQGQSDPNQWNGGYYGYSQGYDYGYAAAAAAPQDPNMYYRGYPGYGNYQQPQQSQQVGYS